MVPARLRDAAGRREFIKSCRTHELAIAKLVACAFLVDWRKQLLLLDSHHMSIDILQLVDGSPALIGDGCISLGEAAKLSGMSVEHLLGECASDKLTLYMRLGQIPGYVVALDDLPDATDIPQPQHMPSTAVAEIFTGVYPISDSAIVAGSLLGQKSEIATIIALDIPGQAGVVFVPDNVMKADVPSFEVLKSGVEALRSRMAMNVSPGALGRAVALRADALRPIDGRGGKWAEKRFADAVRAYSSRSDGLPNKLADSHAQRQRENGLLLFSEFMGNLKLGEIDGDKLRAFRDGPLKEFPNHANRLKKTIKRDTMTSTLAALKDIDPAYERMTPAQQQERMRWLFRFFAWLFEKEYLIQNPASTLVGEDGRTKAQRIAAAQPDDDEEESRRPFKEGEISAIFSLQHYQTGRGDHVKGNEVWYPFQFWLPLLGLFAGTRIKEASQLHLDDVVEVDGVWLIDINRRSADKTLKTDASVRKIPVHATLIHLGFIAYCSRLRAAGYRRVFPELTYSQSPARYAKETGRKMSAMLKKLGMPRDGTLVFHCMRHNLNDALSRVSVEVLKDVDIKLRLYIRYRVIGHELPDDVNARHYTTVKISEMEALVNGVTYQLPTIAPFDIEYGIAAVGVALEKKTGWRKGREDMGPLNDPGTV